MILTTLERYRNSVQRIIHSNKEKMQKQAIEAIAYRPILIRSPDWRKTGGDRRKKWRRNERASGKNICTVKRDVSHWPPAERSAHHQNIIWTSSERHLNVSAVILSPNLVQCLCSDFVISDTIIDLFIIIIIFSGWIKRPGVGASTQPRTHIFCIHFFRILPREAGKASDFQMEREGRKEEQRGRENEERRRREMEKCDERAFKGGVVKIDRPFP